MSETRPLLSDSPRHSVSFEHTAEWTSTSSEWTSDHKSSFGRSGILVSSPSPRIQRKTVVTRVESPKEEQTFSKSQDSYIPKAHRCGTLSYDEQDRRVWISADNPEKFCGEHHRTLVLCFDGTGDQFDDDNSNIVQFLAMLRKDDNSRQLVYYQAGLGTYVDSAFQTPLVSAVSMTLDQMVAWNLGSHVKDGYAFLMQNYTRGDKICIFGFSRGAYTARALAGMLQKVGLLPVCNHQQLPFAYDMYKREDKEGLDMSHDFKKTYSRSVSIDFLGVWDTVSSVGVIPRYLPFIHENTGVRHLRHALALDERRVKFIPQFCGAPKPEVEQKHHFFNFMHHRQPHRESSLWKSYEDLVNSKTGEKTDVEEVWFAGVHCDVGGGATPNWVENKLARIPLRWMIRECFECNTGILFDARMLQRIGLPVYKNSVGKNILAPLYDWTPAPAPEQPPAPPRRPWWRVFFAALWYPFTVIGRLFFSRTYVEPKPANAHEDDPLEFELADIDPATYEHEHDLVDARTALNDEFDKKLLWILLDWIPLRVKKQKAIINKLESGDSWKWLWNRGQGRKIPKSEIEEGLKIHRSVKMRLEQLGEEYTPRARPNIRIARRDARGNKIKEPRSMTHYEWNTPNPEQWTWVGDR